MWRGFCYCDFLFWGTHNTGMGKWQCTGCWGQHPCSCGGAGWAGECWPPICTDNRKQRWTLWAHVVFSIACIRVFRSQHSPFAGSQDHGITERWGLEGTSVGHLVQPPCQSRITYSRLHRTLSRRVLNISREGDSTTSLGSLFQCSFTLRVKKFFFMFTWNFLCFNLCPLPLVLLLGTTPESLAPSFWHPSLSYL